MSMEAFLTDCCLRLGPDLVTSACQFAWTGEVLKCQGNLKIKKPVPLIGIQEIIERFIPDRIIESR